MNKFPFGLAIFSMYGFFTFLLTIFCEKIIGHPVIVSLEELLALIALALSSSILFGISKGEK